MPPQVGRLGCEPLGHRIDDACADRQDAQPFRELDFPTALLPVAHAARVQNYPLDRRPKFLTRGSHSKQESNRPSGKVWIEKRGSPMLRRGAQPIFGRRAAPTLRSTPAGERSRPAMKRSHQVTLVLLGSTALAGWQYNRSASPSPQPQQVVENPARSGCDRDGRTTSPGCNDGRSLAQDPPGRSTGASPSGGHGGSFQAGTSTGASEARANTGTTTFGGFGGSGRAVAAHGAGG